MKQPKTESSSIGDLFGLSRNKPQVDAHIKINWLQVGATVVPVALLLLFFYYAVKAELKRHADNIMPAPKRPAEVKPIIPEEKPQSKIASESPVVEQIISEADKKNP